MRYRIIAFVPMLVTFSQGSVAAERPAKPAAPHVQVASIPARTDDVATLDGIVKAYYEAASGPAGKARQWGRDRSLYIPHIRFTLIMDDDRGKPAVRQLTHQQFADLADPDMVQNGFFEHEIHRITHRYGSWAHIVSTSEARRAPDGPVIAHGIDNLELFWDGKRWWIVYASITDERRDDPLPKEFLP